MKGNRIPSEHKWKEAPGINLGSLLQFYLLRPKRAFKNAVVCALLAFTFLANVLELRVAKVLVSVAFAAQLLVGVHKLIKVIIGVLI